MPSDFTMQPVSILSDPQLRDCDRTVYAGLVSFADFGTGRNCRPSVSAVATRTGRSRSSAVSSIARLVATGWITRHPRKTRDGDADTTEYRFPKQSFAAEVGRRVDLPRSADCPTSVGTLADGRAVDCPTVGRQVDQYQEPCTKSQVPKEINLPSVGAPQASPWLVGEQAREGHQTILDLWAQCCPTLPQPRKSDAASKLGKALRSAWKAEPHADLWRERWTRLASNPWALTQWRPDLGVMLTPAKIEALDNGRYDPKQDDTTRQPARRGSRLEDWPDLSNMP